MTPSHQQGTEPTSPNTAVLDLVREIAPSGIANLSPDTDLVAELGFDSLGLVELLVELEERFELPPLDAEVLAGVERIADLERVVDEARTRIQPGQEPR